MSRTPTTDPSKTGARSEWTIVIDTDKRGTTTFEVQRRGSWFSAADDLGDALGILGGQRAHSVTIDDHGHKTWRVL